MYVPKYAVLQSNHLKLHPYSKAAIIQIIVDFCFWEDFQNP